MESNIPGFGAREFIAMSVTAVAIIGFLVSLLRLTFSKSVHGVQAAFNPSDKGFHFDTKNISIVSLVVSAVLLATMGTVVFSSNSEEWAYLGKGYKGNNWNFLSIEGSRDFKAGDIVVAQKEVDIRENRFGNFTKTWLKTLSRPEPNIVGTLKAGDCVRVLGFESVGFNKIWMKIKKRSCPSNRN